MMKAQNKQRDTSMTRRNWLQSLPILAAILLLVSDLGRPKSFHVSAFGVLNNKCNVAFGSSRMHKKSRELVQSSHACHGASSRQELSLHVRKHQNNHEEDGAEGHILKQQRNNKDWSQAGGEQVPKQRQSNDDLDQSRRNFIRTPGTMIGMAAILAQVQDIQAANAEDSNLLQIDQKKIVMEMSPENIPKKYTNKPSASSSSSITTTEVSTTTSSPLGDLDALTESELRRIAVFEKAAPSVVYIDTFVEQRDAFSTNVMEVPVGTGSGFVWDDRGHIVTNYHVVRSAQSAQIAVLTRVFGDEEDDDDNGTTTGPSSKAKRKLQSQSTNLMNPRPLTSMRNSEPALTSFSRKVYKARVVGVDPGKDIAVLKIDAPVYDLYPIDVGTSTGLKVGQSAYAIGNPFGLDHTLTVGVVSGIGREVKAPNGRPITNVIQTDAAINPGNSGGPLLNSAGKCIGMNTSIYSPSGASAGIGFAIPMDSVKFIVETLIRDGKIFRPVLGISYLESKQARVLGIEKGVLVLDVPTNSPAYKAGMRGTRRTESGLIEIGDIIVKIEDTKINTEADLFAALEKFKAGDVIKVTVNRPDLESPTSKTWRLTPKVFNIPLWASTSVVSPNFNNQFSYGHQR